MRAGVSRAGARTGLQLPGHGDMQGFDSSSPAESRANSGGRLQPDDARQRVLQPCAGMTRTNREVETMLFGIESPAQMVSPPSNSPTAKVPDRQPIASTCVVQWIRRHNPTFLRLRPRISGEMLFRSLLRVGPSEKRRLFSMPAVSNC